MKTLIKFVLAAALTLTGFAAQAGWVSGYYRRNGTYVSSHSVLKSLPRRDRAAPKATG